MDARIRGICFDLDDTLISYEPAVRYALMQTANHPALSNAGISAKALTDAVLSAYTIHYGPGTTGYTQLATIDPEALQIDLTRRALTTLNLPERLVAELRTLYRAAEDGQMGPMPDTSIVLSALRNKVALGVITNGPARMQRAKLKRFELDTYFDTIVIDTEVGASKPDTRIFEHAASTLGLSPSELMFVGDTHDADIRGATDAGWTAVWLTAPDACTCSHTERIHCLRELLELKPIAALLSRECEGGRRVGR